jgi:hypothetical protein
LKIKVGSYPLDEELERLRAIRSEVGERVEMRVDANGAWSREIAREAICSLAELDVSIVEQPVSPSDLEGIESLKDGLPLRSIRTDEYKLVLADDGARELYHVGDAPMETDNIADRRDDICDRLVEDLEQWVGSFEQELTQASTTISPESKKRLQDLGHL